MFDARLTPPLTETLLCASAGILFWSPGWADPVRIQGDDGRLRFNPVAQAAASWLTRHDLIEIPEAAPRRMEAMPITLHGRYELAATRAQAVRKMRG